LDNDGNIIYTWKDHLPEIVKLPTRTDV